MTTSGTATFTRNRDQLISRALRLCSAFESGETPDPEAVTEASEALNAMVKHWQTSGIYIFRTTEAVLFPAVDQNRYTLGTTSTDRAAEDYAETALSSDAAAGANTITVDSIAGISTAYIIGVRLDDDTFQWTTVNGAPSGSTVTLTALLTGAASEGARVFVYRSAMPNPLRVLGARYYNLDSAIDTPIDEYDRAEYQDLPNKTSTGTPNGYFFDRRGGANANGYLYLWPQPENTDIVIKMTVARSIEDFTTAGDTADLPQEWIRAIIWNLADEIADEYDVPEPKRGRIERRAAEYLAEANWNERELLSFQFAPDMR